MVNSEEEPFPGWVDNLNGPIGLFYISATGKIITLGFAIKKGLSL